MHSRLGRLHQLLPPSLVRSQRRRQSPSLGSHLGLLVAVDSEVDSDNRSSLSQVASRHSRRPHHLALASPKVMASNSSKLHRRLRSGLVFRNFRRTMHRVPRRSGLARRSFQKPMVNRPLPVLRRLVLELRSCQRPTLHRALPTRRHLDLGSRNYRRSIQTISLLGSARKLPEVAKVATRSGLIRNRQAVVRALARSALVLSPRQLPQLHPLVSAQANPTALARSTVQHRAAHRRLINHRLSGSVVLLLLPLLPPTASASNLLLRQQMLAHSPSTRLLHLRSSCKPQPLRSAPPHLLRLLEAHCSLWELRLLLQADQGR